jgi:choline kinase
MNAVLYVAGRASRLGDLTAANHKILFDFGGKTLLERHVAALAKAGIETLYVVTGHVREKVAAHFGPLQSRYGIRIEEIFNADYAEGSVLSVHVSLPVLRGVQEPILLMDGDVLYDVRMLERLIRSRHRTALLIDRGYSTADDDPVLVPVRDGRPFEFMKKWKGDAEITGESIGFFKVNPADMPVLVEETEERARRSRSDSYDEVLRAMVKRGLFCVEDATDLPWTEIDFPQDVQHARLVVVPLLQDS